MLEKISNINEEIKSEVKKYNEMPEIEEYFGAMIIPELKTEIEELDQAIRDSIKSMTREWITIGESLAKIQEKIEAVGSGKRFWQTYLGVNSFEEYCKTKLEITRQTATQMRLGYNLIKSLKPELLESENDKIPSYTKLRAITKYSDKITANPGKYSNLVESVFESDKTRDEIQKEVRLTFPVLAKSIAVIETVEYDELIDNLFEDRLKRSDLDEKIRGYKKRKVNVGKKRYYMKDWTKDKVRSEILSNIYSCLLSELQPDPVANIMVTGGKVCLHSELPRIGSFKYSKLYIHEVDKKIFKYLATSYLPHYDGNNKALVFNRNIYTSDHVNISFISNDVHGTTQIARKYTPIAHLPFLWARQFSMALINKEIKQVGMVLNTSVRGAGVAGYKTLIQKTSVLLKEVFNINLRQIYTIEKCYNKQMWTTALIADAPANIINIELINFSNKIEKELTNG